MSWFLEDPDEWETYTTGETYGHYPGTDIPLGSYIVGRRRRPPEEVARLKAERLRAHEDAVLVEADSIRARRACTMFTEAPRTRRKPQEDH